MTTADLTFPIYKLDQLVAFFRMEVLEEQEAKTFSKNDLSPTAKPEAMQMLYMRTLQTVYRVNPACLHMLPIQLMENIEIPSLHEGATAVLRLYHKMRRFLPTCLVHDFTLSDLLSPKTKKTTVILSGIMNFLQFRKQRLEFAQEHETKLRTDKDTFQRLTKDVKNLEKKVAILTTIPPKLQAEARELNSAIGDLKSSRDAKYQEVDALKASIVEWRSKIAERNQALSQLNVDVSNRIEANAALQSQILESPEELKMEMDKMKSTVKSIKAATAKADEFLVELQGKAQRLNHGDCEVQQLCTLLQDLDTGMEKARQDALELDKGVSTLEKQQKELKSLTTELDREKRSHTMKLDKRSKLSLRRKNTREAAERHIQAVMKKCDLYPEKREEMEDIIQKTNDETQQLKAKIQSMLDTCNNETRVAQDMYDRLSATLDRLHRRIETSQNDLHRTLRNEGER